MINKPTKDLKKLAWQTFTNLRKNYYRKYVKPQNTDKCFVEFNTDRITIFDNESPDTNYYDQECLNRRHYIKVIIRALKNNEKKLFSLYHCREVKQVDIASRLNIANVSLSIKRLNQKIMLICKKNKISALIDTRFAIPGWKPEKISMKQSYWTAPSAAPANIRKLESQKGTDNKWQWDKKTKKLVPVNNDVYEYQKSNHFKRNVAYYETSLPSEFTKKRNVKQEGFFGNASNGPRLLKLIESKNDDSIFTLPFYGYFSNIKPLRKMPAILPLYPKVINKLDSNYLIYGSDIFNAWFSQKSIFSSNDSDMKIEKIDFKIDSKKTCNCLTCKPKKTETKKVKVLDKQNKKTILYDNWKSFENANLDKRLFELI